MTLRLLADAVFTVDEAGRVFAPGAVEIGDDGVISWVGDPRRVHAATGTEVRDLGGIVMPGLVNCHGHSPMTLVRSAGDGLPLDRWLTESVWPREARLTDEDVYWGMTLGAVELLGNGITTTCEQYRHPAPVMQALTDAGIRAVYTPGIFEVPGSGPGNTWEDLLDEACALFDAAAPAAGEAPNGLLEVGFGPHAAYTVPPEGLAAVAAEARSRNALVQIHLSETVAECDLVRRRHGMSAPALLASVGALEGRVLAAHAVWLDEVDLGILADHDVAVAHCPGSNGKLGAGVAPLGALDGARRAGRPGDRRSGVQRRPPPVGRDAPGRALCTGPGGRPRSGELTGRAAPGHQGRSGGARARRGRARARTARRPHPAAHR